MTPVDSRPPIWMLPDPEPHQEPRKFNAKEYIGWLGRTDLVELQGWVDNPRIDIPVKAFMDENFGREPDNDELLDIMLDVSVNNGPDGDEDEDEIDNRRSRKNKLLVLAESIRLNGIRVPFVVTHDKRILDGNRRYFATLYLYRLTEDRTERDNYSTVPVWVLPKGITKDDEERILTELNSINDCYEKWPYSVVARRVYRDYKNGMSPEELERRYHDWSKNRIWTVIEASKVAEEFVEYHGDSLEANDLAYRKLVWFDELRRSNRDAMKKTDFREAVFDVILKPKSPFSSHADFKKLGEIYDNPEAWEVLTTRDGKEALRQAQFVLERERYEGKTDAQTRMKRVNSLLDGIVSGPGFDLVDRDVLVKFHKLATQIPGQSIDETEKARIIVEMINGFTSREIARLDQATKDRLASALERLKLQAESYQEA